MTTKLNRNPLSFYCNSPVFVVDEQVYFLDPHRGEDAIEQVRDHYKASPTFTSAEDYAWVETRMVGKLGESPYREWGVTRHASQEEVEWALRVWTEGVGYVMGDTCTYPVGSPERAIWHIGAAWWATRREG